MLYISELAIFTTVDVVPALALLVGPVAVIHPLVAIIVVATHVVAITLVHDNDLVLLVRGAAVVLALPEVVPVD